MLGILLVLGIVKQPLILSKVYLVAECLKVHYDCVTVRS